jgi:hypothetical protein
MEIAIITEKYGDGRAKTIRSTIPLSTELRKQAERLDSKLQRRMQELEAKLIGEGLLGQDIPRAGSPKSRGSVDLWYSVGKQLSGIVKEERIKGPRERRWVWEAIENLHATERVKRASRGRTRMHFEYCYRLGQFPVEVAKKMHWSEWVYFFDSLTVREEPRADKWLRIKIQQDAAVDRIMFRRFTENLNKRIRRMDTSVLSEKELAHVYDQVWSATKTDLMGVSTQRSSRRRGAANSAAT